MSDTLLVILLTGAGFLAVILSLAVGKSANNKIVSVCATVAIVTGIWFYGYGYGWHEGLSLTVVIRTLLMVCRMFSGGCDYSMVSGTPLFESPLINTLFWIGHFAAFYMTASAAIRILGNKALKTMRTRMLRKGDNVRLVYDATPDTLCLAGKKQKKHPIMLVTEQTSERISAMTASLGSVEFPGGAELCADQKFLKTIGIKDAKRELDVYCIGNDPVKNLRYAQALLPALQEKNVPPEALSVFLLGVPEDRASRLMAADGKYGYGALYSCTQYDLIARLIIENRPPWSFIRCDGTGRATNDFRVFIVGFGQMGQAVLRHLLINGQMEGSSFHAEIFDHRMNEERGVFDHLYPALLEQYDIVLHEAAANSGLFYDRLDLHAPSMIVLCSGDQRRNMELGTILYRKYGTRPDRPCLIQCTPDSVVIDETERRLGKLDVREMDRAAIALNHVFRGGPSAEEDWKTSTPLSRISCRAAVAFIPGHLHAAGISPEEAMAGKWPPSSEVLENLSRTEHLRWCSFYLSMGYTPMEEPEFRQRCESYRRGEIGNITNNVARAAHARLIPWEELDGLSRQVSAVTGKTVDYKGVDRSGVLAIPDVLRRMTGGRACPPGTPL